MRATTAAYDWRYSNYVPIRYRFRIVFNMIIALYICIFSMSPIQNPIFTGVSRAPFAPQSIEPTKPERTNQRPNRIPICTRHRVQRPFPPFLSTRTFEPSTIIRQCKRISRFACRAPPPRAGVRARRLRRLPKAPSRRGTEFTNYNFTTFRVKDIIF